MRFIIMIILYYILKYFIVQIFIHLHTHAQKKKTHKVFQNSNETNESETNPKKNICATFAENNFTL